MSLVSPLQGRRRRWFVTLGSAFRLARTFDTRMVVDGSPWSMMRSIHVVDRSYAGGLRHATARRKARTADEREKQ